MELRFISATWSGNTYKPSEFWTYVPIPGYWIMVAGTKVDYNFTADDGLSSLIVNNADMNYRGMTHMLVPTLQKIYEITSYEYENNKQTKLILIEDAFISHYPSLVSYDRKYDISRSNASTTFKGIHDIPQVALEYDNTIVDSVPSNIGKWLLVSFEAGGGPVQVPFVALNPTAWDTRFKTFDTLTNLVAVYPEVTTDNPALYSYFGMICYVLNAGSPTIRQCTYDGTKLVWKLANGGPYGADYNTPVKVTLGSDTVNTRLNLADVPTISILLPFNVNVTAMNLYGGVGTYTLVANAYNFLEAMSKPGETLTTRVISMRIVDENMLQGIFYSGYDNPNLRIMTTASLTTFTDSFTTPYVIITPDVYDRDFNLGLVIPTDDIYDYEPYSEYTLNLYGNSLPINRKLINSDLRLRLSMSTSNIVYTLYSKTIDNIIQRGNIVTNVLYSVDKFAEFLAQNSEYYRVKAINLATSLVSRIGTGTISGAMTGNPAGMVAGGFAGLVSVSQEFANISLNEKAMKNSPDKVRGDASNVDVVLNGLFTIYLTKSSPKASYKTVLDTMYSIKGHPTNTYESIGQLPYYTDPILGESTKLVYGQYRGIIINKYVTNIVNEKLAQGVLFING